METVIRLVNISKKFKNKELYNNVNLTINKGECVGFVGANGTGKSVLFQIIVGLLTADEGEVFVNEKRIGDNGVDFPKSVGILINEPGYIECYTGYKNLLMLAQIQGIIGEKEIKDTMRIVGLNPDDKTPVKKYSMGMKQKLGIVQAIMEKQEIIILDEPYNALDYQTNMELTSLLLNLKDEGRTILLTSHQQDYLHRLCDRIYCIDANSVIEFSGEVKDRYFGSFGV